VIKAAASTAPAVALDPTKAKQLEKLKGAAQQFEAVFLRQMISSMRQASLGDDILGNDASNQFRDMSDAKTADEMAKKGTLGVAEMLLKQFSPQLKSATSSAPPMGTPTGKAAE
jgi:flagellar protein FlgJ